MRHHIFTQVKMEFTEHVSIIPHAGNVALMLHLRLCESESAHRVIFRRQPFETSKIVR